MLNANDVPLINNVIIVHLSLLSMHKKLDMCVYKQLRRIIGLPSSDTSSVSRDNSLFVPDGYEGCLDHVVLRLCKRLAISSIGIAALELTNLR